MNPTRLTLAAAALLLLSAPALTQRNLTHIPDPDPLEELSRLQVAEGLEVNLFAADPDIAKPIQMNWDARGRLWVATSSVYPQLEPGETADDRIVVLEDTDGDGVAEKSTVFADGLLIPTGVLPFRDGAFVANSTELLFLDDTDGDGRADSSEVVLSGFGTEDTHHILHMLRHGPGGYVYFNQSIYIHSNIETPWGPKRLDAGGIWRFRPATLELEVWVRGFVNPWGHQFDDWGQQFATDGAFGEGINYVFPGAAFVAAAGAQRILRGLSPGQPKHCGLAILSGGHLPPELSGTLLANDFRGNRINRFALEESRSGYIARQQGDLVWSDHVAFRPVDVNTGPDGAIYIADWYNPIIQHGEVDFRDPRRDRTHGRIWRVSAKDRPLVPRPALSGAAPERLAAALLSSERWTRDAARQLIWERGRSALEPAVRSLAGTLEPAAPNFERHRLEALWALQSLDVVDATLLSAVLASADHRARAGGVRVLADWAQSIPDARERLFAAAADPHPRVRLEAVNGLRSLGDADAVRRALAALDHQLDGNLDYALWLTCRELQDEWLPRLTAEPRYLGSVERLVYALTAAGSAEALAPAVGLWTSGELSAEERLSVIGLFGRLGGPPELDLLAAGDTLAELGARDAALAALLLAMRQRQAAPTETSAIEALLASPLGAAEELVVSAAALVGRYRTATGPQQLAALAKAPETPAAVRDAALRGLAADGRPAAEAALTGLTKAAYPLALRVPAAAAWAQIDPAAAAGAAVATLLDGASRSAAGELAAAFVGVTGGPGELARALEGVSLPAPLAAAALRAVRASPRGAEALAEALRASAPVGPLGALTEELPLDELARLVAEVRASGDPERGERVYRRDQLQCTTCHAIGGAGGLTGPDLSSIGGSAQLDYLVLSLLQPSDKIKEGYDTLTVLRTDGTLATGVLARRTSDELVLRDRNGEEVFVYTSEIEAEKLSEVSVMPIGLLAELERPDFVDLVAFLSRLGKDGEFRVTPARFVRSWQVLDVTPEVSGALRARGVQAVAQEPEAFPWRGLTSTVSGSLPLGEVPPAEFFAGQRFRILRFGLETPAAGAALLRFSTADGAKMFLGGQPVVLQSETRVELPEGRSNVTLILEEGRFSAAILAIELQDLAGSAARAELTPVD